MKRICQGLISATLLAVLGPVAAQARQQAPRPEELISHARKVTDIRTQGSPPFQLRGSVELFHTTQGELKGTYTLLWVSPVKWRETISLPGYTQIRIADGNRMWRLRNPSYLPYPVYLLQELLDGRDRAGPKTQGNFSKVKARTHKGTREWCFRTGKKNTRDKTYCFDPNSGVLLSKGNKLEDSQYSRYEPWRGKLFAQTRSVSSSGKLLVEFDAKQLSSLGQPSHGAFTPPPGATELTWCNPPVPPKLLKAPTPHYPLRAKNARITGTVRVLGEIGTDGKVHDAYVAVSPNKIFNPPVLNAISDWTYKPASYQGTPAPVETEITVSFWLNH